MKFSRGGMFNHLSPHFFAKGGFGIPPCAFIAFGYDFWPGTPSKVGGHQFQNLSTKGLSWTIKARQIKIHTYFATISTTLWFPSRGSKRLIPTPVDSQGLISSTQIAKPFCNTAM